MKTPTKKELQELAVRALGEGATVSTGKTPHGRSWAAEAWGRDPEITNATRIISRHGTTRREAYQLLAAALGAGGGAEVSKRIRTAELGDSVSDRWITVGGSQHYNVKPYMPDMGWLGEPPSDQQAARYEMRRDAVLRGAQRELHNEQDALAAEMDLASSARRAAIVAQLNELHVRAARIEVRP